MDKISIITTTINNPSFLKYFYNNFYKYLVNLDNIKIIVVGDNKTPSKEWNSIAYPNVEYWDIETQNIYLNKLTKKSDMLLSVFPENNMLRRNFGYLRAIELGSDIIITVDDDNLPIDCNFIQGHLNAFNNKNVFKLRSYNGLINHCEMLNMNHNGVYSRGYPTNHMCSYNPLVIEGKNKSNVKLNMGLWTSKPDVDSTYNIMFNDLNSISYDTPNNFAMYKDNYFSINTQNTAIKKEATRIFHNEYMATVNGYPLHRFDDIWAGLFTLKVIHTNDDTATFGNPIVEHRRNTHNYAKDLNTEYMGLILNNRVWDKVRNMDISKGDYTTGYLEISDNINKFNEFEPSVNKYFSKLSESMRFWTELVEAIE
jgi:hypothetical protein